MAFWSKNIDRRGRIVRLISAVFLLTSAAVFIMATSLFAVGLAIGLVGIFCLFQAMLSWCLFRACGVRTKV